MTPGLEHVRERAVTTLKADADRFAKNVVPIMREIHASGITSHRGFATARGGEWTAVQVVFDPVTC
jgi:hypothetical protein